MLAGTVHVNDIKNKNIYEVKPNQKEYVYVEEILGQIKNKPKSKDRKIHDHFYQKTPKGSYRKIRLDEELNVINPKKGSVDK